MRTAIIGMLILVTAASGQQRPTQFPGTVVDPVLDCTVKVKRELYMSAKDNGALVELAVELGDVVEAGEFLGQIDDNEAMMAKIVAQAQYETAVENAGRGSEIQLKYAQAAADVAKVNYDKIEGVFRSGRAVPEMEVKQAELEWKRAVAQIDVRKLEESLAQFEVSAKQAEVDAAEKALTRRRLTAPFSGIIADVIRRQGEWAQAGDPILRLMNFETMVVKGRVNATRYTRQDVAGKRVTVEMQLPRSNEVMTFTGTITHVSPITDNLNEEFAVEAEVTNRRAGDHWLLPDSEKVTMTIHIN